MTYLIWKSSVQRRTRRFQRNGALFVLGYGRVSAFWSRRTLFVSREGILVPSGSVTPKYPISNQICLAEGAPQSMGFETELLRTTEAVPHAPARVPHREATIKNQMVEYLVLGWLSSPQLLIFSLEVRFARFSAFTQDLQGFECKQESMVFLRGRR
jgi:hypothetical protein